MKTHVILEYFTYQHLFSISHLMRVSILQGFSEKTIGSRSPFGPENLSINSAQRTFTINHYDIMNIGSVERSVNLRLFTRRKLSVTHGPVVCLDCAASERYQASFDKDTLWSHAARQNVVVPRNTSRSVHRIFSILAGLPAVDSPCSSSEAQPQNQTLDSAHFKVTSQTVRAADTADISIRSSKSLGVQTECSRTPANVWSLSIESWSDVNREASKYDSNHREEGAEQLIEDPVCNAQYSQIIQTGAGSDSNRESSEALPLKNSAAIGRRILSNPATRDDDSSAVEIAEGPVEAVTHLLRDSAESLTETGSGYSVEFTQALLIEEISERRVNEQIDFPRAPSESLAFVDSEDRRDSRTVTGRLNQRLFLPIAANDLLGVTKDELQAIESSGTDTPIFVVRKRAKDLWDT